MPRTRPPYPPEFRGQIIELVRAGRSPEELAEEYEPSAQTIRNWVAQADRDGGTRTDGLSTSDKEELRRLRRENKVFASGEGDPEKSRGLVRSGERLDPESGFEFVKRYQADFPIRAMCRVLGLSPSGYYAWRKRAPSPRWRSDQELLAEIEQIHEASRRTYGRLRVHAELRENGRRVNHKRVGRLMRRGGIRGVCRRRKRRTTMPDPEARPAPDLVDRDFSASGPDQLWVADITYVPTAAGFLFLAVVLDAWSRRVVGWAMASHLKGSAHETEKIVR